MARKPETFIAYLLRRKQDHYIFVTVWVAMMLFWLVFPGLLERGDRYSQSEKSIVVVGWPVWLGLTYVTYRGWLGGRKRKTK